MHLGRPQHMSLPSRTRGGDTSAELDDIAG